MVHKRVVKVPSPSLSAASQQHVLRCSPPSPSSSSSLAVSPPHSFSIRLLTSAAAAIEERQLEPLTVCAARCPTFEPIYTACRENPQSDKCLSVCTESEWIPYVECLVCIEEVTQAPFDEAITTVAQRCQEHRGFNPLGELLNSTASGGATGSASAPVVASVPGASASVSASGSAAATSSGAAASSGAPKASGSASAAASSSGAATSSRAAAGSLTSGRASSASGSVSATAKPAGGAGQLGVSVGMIVAGVVAAAAF